MSIDQIRDDMWTLHFDGALNSHRKGIGIVLLSPEGITIPQAFQLDFPVTNNIAEYKVLLAGLKAAHSHGVIKLMIVGDSQLILRQVLTKYRTLNPKLKPYQELTSAYSKLFTKLSFVHVPRNQNILADALASLASSLDFPINMQSESIIVHRRLSPAVKDPSFLRTKEKLLKKVRDGDIVEKREIMLMELLEEMDDEQKPWYYEIAKYCEDQSYPEEATAEEKRAVRRVAQRYTLVGGALYKRGFDGILLRCLDEDELCKVMEGAHTGVCSGHVNGQMLAKKILRQGFYWPTMEENCVGYVPRCAKCQLHADKIHSPASSLHHVSSPWPFSMWAFDII